MSYRTTSLIARASALTAMLLLTCPLDLHAALIKVNEKCSLPDAITAANTDSPVGDCFAGSGPDVLVMTKPGKLVAALPGDNGTPTITSHITIKANGRSIYRARPEDFRLFNVGSTGWLRIENARMFEGKHPTLGGAILVAGGGYLMLINCILDDNIAGTDGGAIATGSGSEIDLIRVTFRNNSAGSAAGALFNRGAANVIVSTFEGNNSVNLGNTVFNSGFLNVTWSTLTGNTGGDSTIDNSGDLFMANSIIETNSSDHAGLLNRSGGDVRLTDCHIEDNMLGTIAESAGVVNDGSITAMGTAICDNEPLDCSGVLIDDIEGNVDSDGTCFTGTALCPDP